MIANDLPGILAAMVEKAKGGDVGAANLLLSRCLAPLRPQSEPEEVATEGTTLAERAEGVSAAVLGGELSPSVAVEMIGILAQEARILETTELMQRIERLENALAATKGKK